MSDELQQRVARAFSRSAGNYEGLALVQAETGRQLLNWLDDVCLPDAGVMLDAGCGSGYLTRDLATLLPQRACFGLDIAQGMLALASGTVPGAGFIAGDMTRLPVRAGACALLFSSFAAQWCGEPCKIAAEFARVQVADGALLLSVPVAGSLGEIAQSWMGVDEYRHANTFFDESEWYDAIAGHFVIDRCSVKNHVLHYASVRECLESVRGIGANVVMAQRRSGLMGKTAWRAFVANYESRREERGVPLTYRVLSIRARKRG